MSTAEARFFTRVTDTGDCWLWSGGVRGSYGAFWYGQRQVPAHRWLYEYLRHPIPTGLQLDHLCRQRLCVNPWHLEPVTAQVNTLRGETLPAACAARDHCPRGHAYKGANVRVTPTGRRVCRACHRINAAASRARLVAA